MPHDALVSTSFPFFFLDCHLLVGDARPDRFAVLAAMEWGFRADFVGLEPERIA
jgi:hypothetical protein